MEFRSSRDDLFYEQTRCRPGFFVTGCRMVTRVFAAINCWRRRGGGFENAWKFSSKRAEMQGATF